MNFYDVFKPLYFLLSVLGLFPYRIKFSKTNYFTIIPKSIYINAICAVSIVLILLVFGILHVLFIVTSTEDRTMIEGFLSRINYIFEIFTLINVCVVTYVTFYLKRYKFVIIINETAKLIKSTNGYEDDMLKYVRLKINIFIRCLPLALILQMVINFTRPDSFLKMILVFFNYNITQTVQFIITGSYYILIKIVILLLKNINENILKSLKDKTVTNSFIKVEPKLTMTLRRLEIMYVEIFKLKREINLMFQAPLLMSTIQCFHSLVSQSYLIYHGIVVDEHMTMHDLINCSCWLPYQFLKIFALAYIGHSLKLEVQSLGQALYKIPTEKDDIKLIIEIQHFSSLMRYHGDGLTLYGLFPLDATLMSKVLASATMYLIILVQFDKKTL